MSLPTAGGTLREIIHEIWLHSYPCFRTQEGRLALQARARVLVVEAPLGARGPLHDRRGVRGGGGGGAELDLARFAVLRFARAQPSRSSVLPQIHEPPYQRLMDAPVAGEQAA